MNSEALEARALASAFGRKVGLPAAVDEVGLGFEYGFLAGDLFLHDSQASRGIRPLGVGGAVLERRANDAVAESESEQHFGRSRLDGDDAFWRCLEINESAAIVEAHCGGAFRCCGWRCRWCAPGESNGGCETDADCGNS